MSRGEHREFMSERIARIEERMISVSQDVTEMKNIMEKSFSGFGDLANRVNSLESFKKFFILIASAVASLVGVAVEAAVNWRSK
jgi:archaellum component FlaC